MVEACCARGLSKPGEHLVTDVFCTSSKVDPLFPLFLLTAWYASIGGWRHLGSITFLSKHYSRNIFTGSVYFDTHYLKLEDELIHFRRLVVGNPGHWYLTGCACVCAFSRVSECFFFLFFYDYQCVYVVNLLFLAFLSTTQPSDGEVQMIVKALCQAARYIHHEPGHTQIRFSVT